MNYQEFEYMYNQSVEIRLRIDHWLEDHPPPPGTPGLRWACHKFIENRIVRDQAEANKNVYDRNRFHVPAREIVKEAHKRRDFGEDAGAALNKNQGRHRAVKPTMLKKPKGGYLTRDS